MRKKLEIANLFLFSRLFLLLLGLLVTIASNCAEKQKKSEEPKRDFSNINDAAVRISGNFTRGPISLITSIPNFQRETLPQSGGQKMTPKLDRLIEFIMTPKIKLKSEDFFCTYLQQIAKSLCRDVQSFECQSGLQEQKFWLRLNASASECEIKKEEDIKLLASWNTKSYLEIPPIQFNRERAKLTIFLNRRPKLYYQNSKIKAKSVKSE